MEITLVGAGNLATCLGLALQKAGHSIRQVWSRTEESAEALGRRLECSWTTDLNALEEQTGIFIVSVKDSVLKEIATQLPTDALVVHTAGSMPLDTLTQRHRGVLYPMQTFSKQRPVSFSKIPIFIEADDTEDLNTLRILAESISHSCHILDSDKRRYLHVAAVFSCNLVNHCYHLAAEVLEEQGIPFDVMLPLIDETASKVHTLSPKEAQTGPAVRWDENVMQRHIQMLDEYKRRVYQMLSEGIHSRFTEK